MAVMDRERWRELEPLLDQFLSLSVDEHTSWLSELQARSPVLAALSR